MPYIDLRLSRTPTTEQAARLAEGITDAMAQLMGKRRAVTAVHIASDDKRADASLWTIAAVPVTQPTAYLDVKITQGTNTPEEKAALIARLDRLLRDTLGELAEASYILIHEVSADAWGYAGRTQAARKLEASQ